LEEAYSASTTSTFGEIEYDKDFRSRLHEIGLEIFRSGKFSLLIDLFQGSKNSKGRPSLYPLAINIKGIALIVE